MTKLPDTPESTAQPTPSAVAPCSAAYEAFRALPPLLRGSTDWADFYAGWRAAKRADEVPMSLWMRIQLKADLFDYLCWLEGKNEPEELRGADRLCMASDGTTCWGKTYAEAVRVAMEHDKGLHDANEKPNKASDKARP